MKEIDVSIIIITWNCEKTIASCLSSISKYTSGISYEIIVVDNNSSDNTVKIIRKNFAKVNVIKSKKNLGFGRAHSLALGYLRGQYTLLLNPDTILKENSIKIMLEYIKNHNNIGILSCMLLNSDESFQSSFWNFPCISESIRECIINVAKIPFELSGKLDKIKEYKMKSREIQCVMGAVMLLKSSIFIEMGGFDRDYFMYGEDTDICWLIAEKGLIVYYLADTEVYHLFGQSSKQINYWREVKTSSALKLFLRKRRGRIYEIIYIVIKVLLNSINIIFFLFVSFSNKYRMKIKEEVVKTFCIIMPDKILNRIFSLS